MKKKEEHMARQTNRIMAAEKAVSYLSEKTKKKKNVEFSIVIIDNQLMLQLSIN